MSQFSRFPLDGYLAYFWVLSLFRMKRLGVSPWYASFVLTRSSSGKLGACSHCVRECVHFKFSPHRQVALQNDRSDGYSHQHVWECLPQTLEKYLILSDLNSNHHPDGRTVLCHFCFLLTRHSWAEKWVLGFTRVMEFAGKCRLKAIRRWMRARAKTETMKTGCTVEVFGEGRVSLLESPMDNWAYTDVLKQESVQEEDLHSSCSVGNIAFTCLVKPLCWDWSDLEIHLFPRLTADILWEVLVTGLRGWLCISTVKGLTIVPPRFWPALSPGSSTVMIM